MCGCRRALAFLYRQRAHACFVRHNTCFFIRPATKLSAYLAQISCIFYKSGCYSLAVSLGKSSTVLERAKLMSDPFSVAKVYHFNEISLVQCTNEWIDLCSAHPSFGPQSVTILWPWLLFSRHAVLDALIKYSCYKG